MGRSWLKLVISLTLLELCITEEPKALFIKQDSLPQTRDAGFLLSVDGRYQRSNVNNVDEGIENVLKWINRGFPQYQHVEKSVTVSSSTPSKKSQQLAKQNRRQTRPDGSPDIPDRQYIPIPSSPPTTQKPRPFTSQNGYNYPNNPQPAFPQANFPSYSSPSFPGSQTFPGSAGYPSPSPSFPSYTTKGPSFPSPSPPSAFPSSSASPSYPSQASFPSYPSPTQQPFTPASPSSSTFSQSSFPSQNFPGSQGFPSYSSSEFPSAFPQSPTSGKPSTFSQEFPSFPSFQPPQPQPSFQSPQQQPSYPSNQKQPSYPSQQQPSSPSSQQLPSFPSSQQQPSFPSSSQKQPSFPSSQQQPSFPSSQQQPSFPSSQQQPSYPSPQQQPSYPSSQQQPSGPSSQQQPFGPSSQQQPSGPSSQQQPFYTTSQQPQGPQSFPQGPQDGFSTAPNAGAGQTSGGLTPEGFTPTAPSEVVSGTFNGNNKHVLAHIHDLQVQCGKDRMTINIEFDKAYEGIIYSKGYYNNPQCRYVQPNTNQIKYTIDVQLNSCGTEFIDEFNQGKPAYLENVLVFQNEPGIQEAWDFIKRVRCTWEKALNKSASVGLSVDKIKEEISNFSGDTAEVRMDVQVGYGVYDRPAEGLIKIGEPMTLVISVEGDPDFDIGVYNCFARDTKLPSDTGNSVALSDGNGCILKRKVLGSFQKTVDPVTNSKIVYAFFQAFKFPEETDLYIGCDIQLVKGTVDICPYEEKKYEPGTRRKRNVEQPAYNTTKTFSLKRKLSVYSPDDMVLKTRYNEYAVSSPLDSDEFVNVGLFNASDSTVCLSTPAFLVSSLLLVSISILSALISSVLWVRLHVLKKMLRR